MIVEEKKIDGNMLVIDCDTVNYKLKMLEANKIPGLPPLEIKEVDGEKKLYYDITSRESFAAAAQTRTMKADDVRSFVYCMSRILVNMDAYLLSPDDLVLDKEYIYVRGEEMEPTLCYLPGRSKNFAEGLSELLQDMLGMVDHNDHEAVVIAYSLYQESLKPGYVMSDLLRLLNGEHLEEKTIQTGKAAAGAKTTAGAKTAEKPTNDSGTAIDELEALYEEYNFVSQDTEPAQPQTKHKKKSLFGH